MKGLMFEKPTLIKFYVTNMSHVRKFAKCLVANVSCDVQYKKLTFINSST